MRFRLSPLAVLLVAFLFPSLVAKAQDIDENPDEFPTPSGVLIGLKGGVVVTTPRRILPSLQIGDATTTTGEISSQFARTGFGNRYGLDLVIPFARTLAFATDIGLLTYSARYGGGAADTTRAAVRLDVQVLQVGVGIQGNLYVNPAAFRSGGVRAVYIGGGFEIGVDNVSNRLEAEFKDPSVVPQRAVGSFANSDPFRTLTGLRFAAGARAGLRDNLEFVVESSYAFALNSVFSSAVIRDNEFTVDNLVVQAGIGYRF